jgi:outer membrane protein assembly factor BamB
MRLFPYAMAVLVAAASPDAQDWPQWRGPNRDGVTSAPAPARWADRATLQWKTPVGIGHSSPVVAGGRAFVHARQVEREVVSAIDLATGKTLWTGSYDAPYQVNPAAARHGKGPKSTPVVRDGIVYTLGISGILSAFDAATGAVKWRVSFGDRFPQTAPQFGDVSAGR